MRFYTSLVVVVLLTAFLVALLTALPTIQEHQARGEEAIYQTLLQKARALPNKALLVRDKEGMEALEAEARKIEDDLDQAYTRAVAAGRGPLTADNVKERDGILETCTWVRSLNTESIDAFRVQIEKGTARRK